MQAGSIGNTLEHEPTHIWHANKKELIKKFMEEYERCRKNFQKVARAEYMPDDIHLLPGKQQKAIRRRRRRRRQKV